MSVDQNLPGNFGYLGKEVILNKLLWFITGPGEDLAEGVASVVDFHVTEATIEDLYQPRPSLQFAGRASIAHCSSYLVTVARRKTAPAATAHYQIDRRPLDSTIAEAFDIFGRRTDAIVEITVARNENYVVVYREIVVFVINDFVHNEVSPIDDLCGANEELGTLMVLDLEDPKMGLNGRVRNGRVSKLRSRFRNSN